MTSEQVLAGVVRARANQELPGEREMADRAVWLAATSYADDASITQACAEERADVGSRIRLPARGRARPRRKPPAGFMRGARHWP